MTLIITAIVIQTIIKIELPLIKSYFKINSPVFVTQSVVYVTIFAKLVAEKSCFQLGNPVIRIMDREQNLCIERSIEGEKTCHFDPFGIQNTQNRSRVAFVHSYAAI